MKFILTFFALVISLSNFGFADVISISGKRIEELSTQIESEKKKLNELIKDKSIQQSKLNKIQSGINRLQYKLDELVPQKTSAEVELRKINSTISKNTRDIAKNSRLLDRTTLSLLTTDISANPVEVNLDKTLLGLCSKSLIENLESISAYQFSKKDESIQQQQIVATYSSSIQTTKDKFNYSVNERSAERKELSLIKKIESNYHSHISEIETGINRLENFILQQEAEKTGKDYSFSFKQKIIWPLTGRLLTHFGTKYNGNHTSLPNEGIIIESQKGTPVKSIASGIVAYANWFEKKGNLIIIDHKNGFYSLYGFNDKLNVKKGDPITRGQIISRSGSDPFIGKDCLYFELRKAGHPIDPLEYLN